jgi:hypothetical protein
MLRSGKCNNWHHALLADWDSGVHLRFRRHAGGDSLSDQAYLFDAGAPPEPKRQFHTSTAQLAEMANRGKRSIRQGS